MKCESCIYAVWERDEFIDFWFPTGCKLKVLLKDRIGCKYHKSLDIDKAEAVSETLKQQLKGVWR